MSLICLLVLVPPRTWPMRSYWRWARPSRWPISWLCRPRGPSSTRTPRRDWLQTWWRPGPANLCPDRVAAFGSQRWVGLRAAQKQREWKLLKRCLYLNRDFEKKTQTLLRKSRRNTRLLKMILALIAATCINFRLTIVTQLDIYCEMCTCFSFGKDGSSRGRRYLLDSTQKSEGRTSRWEDFPSNDMNKHRLYCCTS